MVERLRPWVPFIVALVKALILVGLLLAATFAYSPWMSTALMGYGFVMLVSVILPEWWKPVPLISAQKRWLEDLYEQYPELRP